MLRLQEDTFKRLFEFKALVGMNLKRILGEKGFSIGGFKNRLKPELKIKNEIHSLNYIHLINGNIEDFD